MIAPQLAGRYAAGMKATILTTVCLFISVDLLSGSDDVPLPKALIDGNGPGWRVLGESDFVNVNCDADTWSFKDGKIQCTGKPTGVMRVKEQIKNFELVVQWMHQKPGGNSG